MKRVLFGIFCFVLSLSFPFAFCSQQLPAQSPPLRLYVGEVKGDEDLVKSVRAQIVDELANRGVTLVASPEDADATLTGIGVHRTSTSFMIRTRTTVSIVIRGDVQLNARDGRKLWTSDVSSTRWALSETASFAQVAASRVAQVLRQIAPLLSTRPEKPAA